MTGRKWRNRRTRSSGRLLRRRERSGRRWPRVGETLDLSCHPERSEGSAFCGELQIPRFARDDNLIKYRTRFRYAEYLRQNVFQTLFIVLWLPAFQQHHRICYHCIFRPHAFWGFCFDAYTVWGNSAQLGDLLANRVRVRANFWNGQN